MDYNELIELLAAVFDDFIDNDEKLLEIGISEWSLQFRFAHYLACYLERKEKHKNKKIDIEYNRNKENIKMLNNKNFRPDIIFHERTKNNNIFCCEIKKNSCKNNYDAERLSLILEQYLYQYAINLYKFCKDDSGISINLDIYYKENNKIKIDSFKYDLDSKRLKKC